MMQALTLETVSSVRYRFIDKIFAHSFTCVTHIFWKTLCRTKYG